MKEIRVALIGFGGIARSHAKGYQRLAAEGVPVRLVAVCDVNPARFTTAVSMNLGTGKTVLPEGVHTYTDVEELLANEEFDMADVCLPTDLHKPYAIRLMEAGKHVLSEKPMALCSADCDEMLAVANRTGVRLMIGQVLRFDAAYLYLKECVESGCFGAVRHVFMHRMCGLPRWGHEHWFEDHRRSGGCLLDTHIHDLDMARFLFGEPYAASAVSIDGDMRFQAQNTRLYYKNMLVSIDGSWDEASTVHFCAGFRVRFEKASVILEGGRLTVYPEGEGEPYTPEIPQTDPMTEEIRMFVSLVGDPNLKNEKNTPESARQSVYLVEKLYESVARDGEIVRL